jgi:transposase-like protein
MNRPRRQYSTAGKVAILLRPLLERIPISDACDQYSIGPSMFYNWLKQFFENSAATFEHDQSAAPKDRDRVIAT